MHQHLLANKEVSRNITWTMGRISFVRNNICGKKKFEYWTKETKVKKMDDGELWKCGGGPHLHWSLSNRWFVRFAIRNSQFAIHKTTNINKLKRKKQSKPATRFRFRSQIFLTPCRSHSSLSLGIAGENERERTWWWFMECLWLQVFSSHPSLFPPSLLPMRDLSTPPSLSSWINALSLVSSIPLSPSWFEWDQTSCYV